MLSEPGIPKQSFSWSEAQPFSVVSSCPELPCSEISVGRAPQPQVCERGDERHTAGPSPKAAAGFWSGLLPKNRDSCLRFPRSGDGEARAQALMQNRGAAGAGGSPLPHNLPQEPEPGSDATTTTLAGSEARGSPG